VTELILSKGTCNMQSFSEASLLLLGATATLPAAEFESIALSQLPL
jgi:hypothetical protein